MDKQTTQDKVPKRWSWLLLFTTSGTLICCAIPIILVSLGLGSAVASMAANAPWIITLSQYKGWTFTVSGLLILLAAWSVYRPGRYCPTDPVLAAACEKADRWNKRFIWISALLWAIGLFAAYGLIWLTKLDW